MPEVFSTDLNDMRPVTQGDVADWLKALSALGMLRSGLFALLKVTEQVAAGKREMFDVAGHIMDGPQADEYDSRIIEP